MAESLILVDPERREIADIGRMVSVAAFAGLAFLYVGIPVALLTYFGWLWAAYLFRAVMHGSDTPGGFVAAYAIEFLASSVLALLIMIPAVLSVIAVGRAVYGGAREARPIVICCFLASTAGAYGVGGWWWWINVAATTVVLLMQCIFLGGALRPGPPPMVTGMHRAVGLLVGVLPVPIATFPWWDAPVLGWLTSPDAAWAYSRDAIGRAVLADGGLPNGSIEALLAELRESGANGLAVLYNPTGSDIALRAAPRVFTEGALGVLTKSDILISIGVALLTLAPVVVALLRSLSGQTNRTTVCSANAQRIPGKVVRWELSDCGWRGLFVPGWISRLALRDRVSLSRPTSSTGYVVAWRLEPPPRPLWIPAEKLKVRSARARTHTIRDLLAYGVRGVLVGIGGIAGFYILMTSCGVVTDLAWVTYTAAHVRELPAVAHLSEGDRLRLQADLLSGFAQIERTGLTRLAALVGLVATGIVGGMVVRGRSEPIASDVVVWWGNARRRRFAIGVIDSIRYGRVGWEARFRRGRYRRVLGWFPLAEVRRPDEVPTFEPTVPLALSSQSEMTISL